MKDLHLQLLGLLLLFYTSFLTCNLVYGKNQILNLERRTSKKTPRVNITTSIANTVPRSIYLFDLINIVPNPPSDIFNPSTIVIIIQAIAKFCRMTSST